MKTGPNTAYPPFYPRGATNIASGLRECIRGMQGQKLDKAVTIIITDEVSGEGLNIWNAAFASAPDSDKSCDEVLRSYGPRFLYWYWFMGYERKRRKRYGYPK